MSLHGSKQFYSCRSRSLANHTDRALLLSPSGHYTIPMNTSAVHVPTAGLKVPPLGHILDVCLISLSDLVSQKVFTKCFFLIRTNQETLSNLFPHSMSFIL